MTKQAFSNKNQTGAKAKKPPVKAGGKKSVFPVVIGKTKKTASASVAIGEKKHASPQPVPEGWPVSSHLPYPTPSCNGGETSGSTMIALDSEIPSKNYLAPGNLLRQSCNGSDIYLRKRAVQSTSSIYPSAAAVGGDRSKGGPTRFLIIFPGRLSLKAPPLPPPSSNDNLISQKTSERAEEQKNEENGDTTDKKKNPFAPTNPPHLLGKLIPTSLTKEGCIELRIPLPSSSNSAALSSSCGTMHNEHQQHTIVMAGRAIPLSGKYMALSFKRTGGSKDSVPTVGGGVGGSNKKKGTGSIICKDVFRSVIVLGDSKILDGDGRAVPLDGLAQLQSKNDEEREKDSPLDMLHYGGSDRALDGGGKYNDRINGGRQSRNGGIPVATTTSYSRKESISSKESEDSDSNAIDVMDVEDNNGDSSDANEFIPTSVKKRKSAGGSKKSGASQDASSDEGAEDFTPVRKRTPRRSAETSKISYVDRSSDEDDLDSSGIDEADSDEDDAYKPSRSKTKPSITRSALTPPVANTNKAPTFTSKAGSKSKKSTPVLSVDSSEDDTDAEERTKQSRIRQTTKLTSSSRATKRRQGSAAKKVNFSPSNNDIINVDSDEDETEEDELHSISVHARKRLSTLLTNPSQLKSSSPISRGRRKKNSPIKSPRMAKKDNDLSLDDDPFSFL